jgi:ATP-binding cassette subfamily B protein
VPAPDPTRSFLGDLGGVWSQRRVVWELVPKKDKSRFIGAIVLMALVALIETGIAILLGAFFARVLKLTGQPADELIRFAVFALGILAGAYLLKETINLVRRRMVQNTTSRIERDMTVRLVGHLLKSDLEIMASERMGSLSGRISRSVEGYVKFLKISFTDAIPAVLTALFALCAGFYSEWRVGLVMLGVVPLSILLTVWQVISQKGIRLALLQAKEQLDGTVVEQLGGLEYIRAANTYRQEITRVETAANARREREIKHQLAMSRFEWLKAANENLFHVAIIGFAIYLAARGQADYGKVFAFSMLFQNIMRPLREVHRILDETYETSMQVSILLGMLKQPVDQSFGVVTLRPPRLDGSVPLLECQDLVVEYDTPQGPRRILDGVTLAITQGQTIGIAGPSGSGKSTWLRAMLRLLHPDGGEVLVGGVPIEVLSREDIGKSIGYVSQTPFVFAGTVRDNIAYGCGTVTEDQVQQAARQAHVHEDILEMPQGYDTPLTERGGNLSGGQRQRISLARMFLKNPPVLILDEGTSALDNISERRVRAAIDHARQSHTVIMVAHRLSTLRDTDRIFVFAEGRVAEQGSFEELVARNGVFAELVRSAEAH